MTEGQKDGVHHNIKYTNQDKQDVRLWALSNYMTD